MTGQTLALTCQSCFLHTNLIQEKINCLSLGPKIQNFYFSIVLCLGVCRDGRLTTGYRITEASSASLTACYDKRYTSTVTILSCLHRTQTWPGMFVPLAVSLVAVLQCAEDYKHM